MTVVVPVYNYARYLVEALDSVAAQTVDRLDLIVVDDRSTDDSLEVARAWMDDHGRRFNRVTAAADLGQRRAGPRPQRRLRPTRAPRSCSRWTPTTCLFPDCVRAADGRGDGRRRGLRLPADQPVR